MEFTEAWDGGDHFVESNEGLDRRYVAQPVVHPEQPKMLFTAAAPFALFSAKAKSGHPTFYRSKNQGASWESLPGGLPDDFKAAPRATAGDPGDPAAFFVGMTNGTVWMSQDSGESFRQILQGLPEVSSIRVVHR